MNKEDNDRIARILFPEGIESKGHYYAGTYAVHLNTGKWCDYESNKSGTDITSLFNTLRPGEQIPDDPITQAVTNLVSGKRTVTCKQIAGIGLIHHSDKVKASQVMVKLGYVRTALSPYDLGWQHRYKPSHLINRDNTQAA